MSTSSIWSGSLLGQAEANLAASNSATHKSSLDKDDFLTLLVTQLQQQDPMNPMEDKEFVAQMAQFSSLEQLTNINSGIESMTANASRQDMQTAVSLIGKDVRAEGYNVSKEGDKVSTVYYGLGETVTSAYINIYDQNGNLIRTDQLGSKAAGSYEYVWDGKDWTGKAAPDGVYSVAMAAQDSSGKPVLIQTEVSGEVDGVLAENGSNYVRLKDGRILNFANVSEVVAPGSTSSD